MTDTKTPRFINARRRGFLQGAAVAGGAVATGAALSSDVPNPLEKTEAIKTESSGYKRTEHVSRYYSRARF